ncbi:conserved hypothetical protein [Aspergillus fumigatus A1163]|uniref:Uncharacterized protein n=1 Tax=Aspergillus fumigatus (strain CBS 144.89 / FGSC A1163 / CEA10) TaxID=451804 RepID=B0Y0E6_ASPFC|nr:conserved hypothetical protein [Aspergillus fumigatus A1163]
MAIEHIGFDYDCASLEIGEAKEPLVEGYRIKPSWNSRDRTVGKSETKIGATQLQGLHGAVEALQISSEFWSVHCQISLVVCP